MRGMENIKFVNTQHGRHIYHWKNLKKKGHIKVNVPCKVINVHCTLCTLVGWNYSKTCVIVYFRPTWTKIMTLKAKIWTSTTNFTYIQFITFLKLLTLSWCQNQGRIR